MTSDLSTQPGMGRCEITGKIVPEDELVVINGQRVCAEGKAILLERLKAGEAAPGEADRPTVLRRFGCIVLDSLILSVPNILLIGAIAGFGAAFHTRRQTGSILLGVAELIVAVIGIAYFTLLHGTRGQSVGKMAGKLRVVRIDGQPMDLQTGFVRALGYVGPNVISAVLAMAGVEAVQVLGSGLVGLYALANVLAALFDRSRQRAIHDRIAGTRVVTISP